MKTTLFMCMCMHVCACVRVGRGGGRERALSGGLRRCLHCQLEDSFAVRLSTMRRDTEEAPDACEFCGLSVALVVLFALR